MSNLISGAPRSLGQFDVGPIAYGMWRFDNNDISHAQSLVEAALAAGMNLIDTADIYGFQSVDVGFGEAEEIFGRVLGQAPHLREQMVLATKGGITPPMPYNSSAEYLRSAVEASLRRLQVDVIDLYQVHRPDMFTHPAEVAATLTALRDEGKISEVGVSNYTPDQYDALAAHLDFPMATTQPEYSVLQLGPLRDGTFDRAMRDGVTPLAWSPLGGGRIFADGPDGMNPELTAVIDGLAEREGVDRTAIALGFVLAHPSDPVAIIGTQKTERIASSTAALSITLDRNDVYAIVQASERVPLP
ncbi:MAG: aldo/keto reductase [Acidimicrobiaceae bacterium]|nr:aldo/keto reductase [Acidimicrobiaceae bacterium]